MPLSGFLGFCVCRRQNLVLEMAAQIWWCGVRGDRKCDLEDSNLKTDATSSHLFLQNNSNSREENHKKYSRVPVNKDY